MDDHSDQVFWISKQRATAVEHCGSKAQITGIGMVPSCDVCAAPVNVCERHSRVTTHRPEHSLLGNLMAVNACHYYKLDH